MIINVFFLLYADAPVGLRHARCCGAVYRLPVACHPFAYTFQSLQRGGRKFSVGLRTDVEQQVSIFAGGFYN